MQTTVYRMFVIDFYCTKEVVTLPLYKINSIYKNDGGSLFLMKIIAWPAIGDFSFSFLSLPLS